MNKILVVIYMCLLTRSLVVGAQDKIFDELRVIRDLRGIAMVYVPKGSIQVGVTLEDALKMCEKLAITPEYPPCRTLDGLPYVEKSRKAPEEADVGAFYIDQYEASRLDYRACVDADVCSYEPFMHQPEIPLDVPVQYASYYDAAIYCAWREARLPTAVEWEYAARGPDGFMFPWGDEFDGDLGNHCDVNCRGLGDAASQSLWNDGYSELAPVNAFGDGQSWVGAYNMAGNVQEWTSTRSALNQSPTDNLRVIKGGSYDAYPYQIAGWFIGAFISDQGRANIGFRCTRKLV